MLVQLNDLEKKRLVHFAEKEMTQGHWGDSNVTVPEHQIMLDRLNAPGGDLELTDRQFETVMHWIDFGTKSGRIVTSEDSMLGNKIYDAFIEDYKNLKDKTEYHAKRFRNYSKLLGIITNRKEIAEDGGSV